MSSDYLICAVAFAATAALMLLLRPVAFELGFTDKPGGRKRHVGEIPLTGGIAMTGGLLVAMLMAQLFGRPFEPSGLLLPAACVLVLVGALDDRFDLPKRSRLVAQFGAAFLMVYGAEMRITDLGEPFFGGVVQLGPWSPAFTVLAVVTAINAMNFYDGSNGVAGGQAIVALALFAIAAFLSGSVKWLPLIGSFIACLAAFLIFNWPASRLAARRAFMGDAGSTMLGFTLAWLAIGLSQGESRTIPPVCVLWMFALPLFDFLSCVIRRLAQGRSPFSADAEHLHHVVRCYGRSERAPAVVAVVGAAVLGGGSVYSYFAGVSDGIQFAVWAVTGIAYYVFVGSGFVLSRRLRQARPKVLYLDNTEFEQPQQSTRQAA